MNLCGCLRPSQWLGAASILDAYERSVGDHQPRCRDCDSMPRLRFAAVARCQMKSRQGPGGRIWRAGVDVSPTRSTSSILPGAGLNFGTYYDRRPCIGHDGSKSGL